MRNLLCIIILLKVLLLFGQSQECLTDSGQPQVDFIQTGIYSLTNANYQKPSESHVDIGCYQIPLTYTPPGGKSFSLILSTIQISSQTNKNADFSLRTLKKWKSFSIILMSGLNNWKSYTVSYLVTSRDDLIVGSFIFDALLSNGCDKKDNQLTGSHTISMWNKPFLQGQNLKLKLFVSGIRNIPDKNGTFVLLTIKSSEIDLGNGIITFVLRNLNLNAFLNIQFNYLIFSQTTFKYQLEEVSINRSAVILSQKSFKNKSLYSLAGLITYNSDQTLKNVFNVVSFYQVPIECKGSKCIKKCISKKQCLMRQGKIVKSIKESQQCLLECGQNQVYNSKNQCQCAYGYQRKNSICQMIVLNVNCKSSQFLNFTTRKCQCLPSYILVNGRCQTRCWVNGYMNGTKCQCLAGYKFYQQYCYNCTGYGKQSDRQNNRCACSQPTFYEGPNDSCIRNTCPGNMRYSLALKKCYCQQKQIQINGNYCYPKCGGENQFQNGSWCQCVAGFTLVKQKNGCYKKINCTKPNEIVDSTGYECICKQGYEKYPQTSNQNECIFKCPSNQILSPNKLLCQCSNGYQRDPTTGKCQQITPNCQFNEIYDKNLFSCKCKDGYVRSGGFCIIMTQNTNTNIVCNAKNEEFSQMYQQCVCMKGFQKNLNGQCQIIQLVKNCQQNSNLKNGDCVCNIGYVKSGQSCLSICPFNEVFNSLMQKCQCKQGMLKINGQCSQCPSNSQIRNNQCICQMGMIYNTHNNSCQPPKCDQFSLITLVTLLNKQTIFMCKCVQGYAQNSQTKICQKVPDPVICPVLPLPKPMITCPQKSTWDSTNFKCVCIQSQQNLINGKCAKCPQNQAWNGHSCACLTGYNLVYENCIKCDINSVYRNGKCDCKWGFFDLNQNLNALNTICKICHSTCGTCTGALQNQCLTCADPQAILSNAKCTANTKACPKGYFNSTSGCKQCGQYCGRCNNENQCLECISGFYLQKVDILGSINSFCPQICGDGKRFQYDCDDGNLKDGDGCDSNCYVQNGWTCDSGSSTSPSVCLKTTKNKSFLTVTKPIRMIGQVAQGVTLSYIPEKLSQNLCAKCNDVILVKLISYSLLPTVQVSYLPTTRFKFLIKFIFNGIFAIPDFMYSVQINPKYEKYFSIQDIAQRQIVPVSSVDLALNNPQQELLSIQNPYNIF